MTAVLPDSAFRLTAMDVHTSRSLFRRGRAEAHGVAGWVTREPATMDDEIWIGYDSLGDEQQEGPIPWVARGTLLPQMGDRVLLLIDDQGDAMALVWATAP